MASLVGFDEEIAFSLPCEKFLIRFHLVNGQPSLFFGGQYLSSNHQSQTRAPV